MHGANLHNRILEIFSRIQQSIVGEMQCLRFRCSSSAPHKWPRCASHLFPHFQSSVSSLVFHSSIGIKPPLFHIPKNGEWIRVYFITSSSSSSSSWKYGKWHGFVKLLLLLSVNFQHEASKENHETSLSTNFLLTLLQSQKLCHVIKLPCSFLSFRSKLIN